MSLRAAKERAVKQRKKQNLNLSVEGGERIYITPFYPNGTERAVWGGGNDLSRLLGRSDGRRKKER